ncbi:MAG: phospho-N-acetylmuramoyl-pentapeptide-transferase [Eubacteriales bacterium]|nr:phospho-N-acetylmuramoyl-pentapeptide-transferase [Eubacteriales bacterium]
MRPRFAELIEGLWKLDLMPLALALILSLCLAYLGIKLLRRFVLGQTVREEGPQSHYKKSGTPTLGGLFFIIPTTLFAFYKFQMKVGTEIKLLAIACLLFGILGLVDDLFKLYKDKGGLTVKQKTAVMTVLAIAIAFYYLYLGEQQAIFVMPLSNEVIKITGLWRILYLIFSAVYIYFIVNAVNLTDGIDGLASSISVLVLLGAALFANFRYLPSELASALTYFALILASTLIAFLFFNRHPAKVFMGDTGSLYIGAAIALIYLYIGKPWLLLLIGFVYVLEALSVVIQVAYFKLSGGRRIFKMTPIHHHFELSKWSENKIVVVFSVITVVGGVIGYLISY